MLRKIISCVILILAIWLAGLFWFVGQIPSRPSDDTRPADAIVVLTGGLNRLDYGISELMQGRGALLFITGVSDNLTLADLLHNVSPASRRFALEHADKIMLGHQAGNTIGNAEETKRWLDKSGYSTIRLVTANYHMPRSLDEFHAVMPSVTIIPDPVFPDDFSRENWWRSNTGWHLMLSEYHKTIASMLRHWYVGG